MGESYKDLPLQPVDQMPLLRTVPWFKIFIDWVVISLFRYFLPLILNNMGKR